MYPAQSLGIHSPFHKTPRLANASVSDPIAILSTRALARSDSQRGSFGSTTLGCTLAGLGGLLYLFLLLPTWVDRGRGGVGWGMLTLVWSCIRCARYVGHRVGWGGVGWGMLTLVWSCIGCARYVGHRVGWGGVGWGMLTLVWSCIGCARCVGHRVGWGGVGHVDVGLKLHRMCTLRWT